MRGDVHKPVFEQRLKRERRVAQPHEPVVPVANPTELFRERSRGGRGDPAGIAIRQGPQREN